MRVNLMGEARGKRQEARGEEKARGKRQEARGEEKARGGWRAKQVSSSTSIP
jgi:hypothetical protein